MAIKVAIIGAGSLGFTRNMFRDIVSVPELVDTHFHFMDIDKRNLDMVADVCQRQIDELGIPATIDKTLDRREALTNADYVINCVRIGRLEAFETDVEIPLKYGVDQCVGDTLCIGGIMYGQRNIAYMLDLCDDINDVANDNVLMLSYANPNAMNTWVANEFGNVPTVGLCHGVQGGHRQIASVIELLINKDKKPESKGYKTVTQDEVDIICAGINHQTWYVQVIYDGIDWTDRLLEGFEKHPVYSKQEKVRIDMLRRFGYYSTESNGHLSEYVPWYRKRTKEIKQWISMDNWIHGETCGYLRTCQESREWFKTAYPEMMAEEVKPLDGTRSCEHGSFIIEALETGRIYRGHFNVVNNGCISNLADDCIVEVPGYVDKNGMSIPKVGDLPLACAATLSSSVNVQRMAVYAGVTGDVELLKQAALHDPLTGAVCNPEEIWQMVDEMLIAGEKWLPQFASEIPAAKKRLAAAKRNGTYKGTHSTKGASRKKTKKVAAKKTAKKKVAKKKAAKK